MFNAMRQLKELLWYLAEARAALPSGPLREGVDRAQVQTRLLVESSAAALEQLDTAANRVTLPRNAWVLC